MTVLLIGCMSWLAQEITRNVRFNGEVAFLFLQP